MKATAIAPANIAFIKYWGRKNHEQFLPLTTTNSMNLAACTAKTTVEFSADYEADEIIVKAPNMEDATLQPQDGDKTAELFKALDRLRAIAGVNLKAKVLSELNFPYKAGIASSAAGIAAFTAATLEALELRDQLLDKAELSRQVRKVGSVSAARSVADGYTEAVLTAEDDCYVRQIAPAEHWDLVDVVAVVGAEQKSISTSQGHLLAETSPFLEARVRYLQEKVIPSLLNGGNPDNPQKVDRPDAVKEAILEKNFNVLADLAEADALNMHAVMLTSTPSVLYLGPKSLEIMRKVWQWRADGLPVFVTFDAGPNAHLITLSQYQGELLKLLKDESEVNYTIASGVGKGVQIVSEHLESTKNG